VFTYRAVLDLLELQQLDLLRTYGVPVWPNIVDRLVAKLSPRFAGDVVYVVKKRSAQPAG
jgi:hypothetical protein